MDWKALESRPGSFSKNFGWNAAPGLKLLHRAINEIFQGELRPVPRERARNAISDRFAGDPLVLLNFFLYNKVIDGTDHVVADQLVLQALAKKHDRNFDQLAIAALNFSRVGRWTGARPYQRHPAPWARNFVVDVLYENGRWNAEKIQTDIMERYLDQHLVHRGGDARKFATNLNFLYRRSGMLDTASSETEDWWGAALFLFLDRCILGREIDASMTTDKMLDHVDREKFWALTAIERTNGRHAARGLIEEYKQLGGLDRLEPPREDAERSRKRPSSPAASRRDAKLRQPSDLSLSPVQRVFVQARRQIRNRSQVTFLKNLYEDACAVCAVKLEIDRKRATYSEAGHVKPVGTPINGPDDLSNILLFCPNHHKAFDHGGIWIAPSGGKGVLRSATADTSFDGNPLRIHRRHGFDLRFAEWHARYFGHV